MQFKEFKKSSSNPAGTVRFKISAEADVNTKVRNVQRIIKECKYIQRKKLMQLTKQHKEARLQFAEKFIHWMKRII